MTTTLKELLERLKEVGQKCTILGIGPVSENIIKATFAACRRRKCPPVFIASRNQVDLEKFGGGYLMGGMDQYKFVKIIKDCQKVTSYEGPVYICRDHGGPWQRNSELDGRLPVKEAMDIAVESFEADIKAGFNYLHIDPTKCPHDFTIENLCDWTVELVERCEKIRIAADIPPIDYEVGAEDIQGGLTEISVCDDFLKSLLNALDKKGLPHPTCIVGQTGTLTKMDKNVGHFNRESVKALVETAQKYGIGLKEHNGDYLSGVTCGLHPLMGVAGMNVAPEFGLVETDALLELYAQEEKYLKEGWVMENEFSRLGELFKDKTFANSPWRKWMTAEQKKMSGEEIEKDDFMRLLIARVCGHYVYDDPEVAEAIRTLHRNFDAFSEGASANEFVLEKLIERVEFYIKHFNMGDINVYCKTLANSA